jgi:phage shock protein E
VHHRRRVTGLLLALSLVLAGCGALGAAAGDGPDPADGSTAATSDGALDDLAAEAEGRVLVDVRTPEEVAEGHLAGALLLDLHRPDFRDAVAELPRDEAYFVYCRTGNRSGQAIEIMRELGFTDLVNGGGFDDLARAGLETAS